MLSSLRFFATRAGPWPRRAVALTCLILAAGSFLTARPARAPAASTGAVVVVARSLPIGHRLTTRDLVRRTWPDALRPPDALSRPDTLVGRVLATPVTRGEPVTPRRVVGRELTSGLGPDQVAAVVGVVDPTATSLIRAGDRVDVLAAPAGVEQAGVQPSTPLAHRASPTVGAQPTVLVTGARVLAVLSAAGELQPESDVVIATDRATAARVVRARASQMLTVLARSP